MVTATRDNIRLAKACARAIVHECAIRMDVERTTPVFDTVRKIQLKYGEYLFELLTDKLESDLDQIIAITPGLIRRIRDPKDDLSGVV